MTTYDRPIHELMHEFAEQNLLRDQKFGKKLVRQWFKKHYPKIDPSSVDIHVNVMSVNSQYRRHHRHIQPSGGWDLFYRLGPDDFRLWDRENDSSPRYANDFAVQQENSKVRFWWVNQNQTFESEIGGGYLWSPKTRKDGGQNQFYMNMTLVEPGDIVFSFFQQRIGAIGIAEAKASTDNKPNEFGSSGDYWNTEGWKLPVRFFNVERNFRPKDYMEQIGPLLPQKYSPIQLNGNGNQGAYLAALSDELGRLLLILCESEISNAIDETESIKTQMRTDIGPTTKLQLVQARRGQGIFRYNLLTVEKKCRVTGLSAQDYLIASHIKPWCKSDDEEKIDGHNGLLLAPHIDRLFDRGLISFEDDGTLITSSSLPAEVNSSWLSSPIAPTPFLENQIPYILYHRDNIFR